jgi:signal transduction histidine kinase
MERLVQQVLTFRRVEHARGLGLEPEAPAELVERALQPFTLDEASAERLELVVEPHLPRVLADGDAVVDAIRNLVENALKYSTNPGPVVVTLRSDGEGIAVSVRDQGPAIPSREQRRIFKRFYRAATGKPGSGLGLAIARQIARAHGGRLDLRCSEDMGNVFNLRLPLVVPDTNGLAAAFEVADEQGSVGKRPTEG